MEHQKILFADLYRLINAIKDEIKVTNKEIGALLETNPNDWESLSITVNHIIAEASLISSIAQGMIQNGDQFLQDGPYAGERAGILPLEQLANN